MHQKKNYEKKYRISSLHDIGNIVNFKVFLFKMFKQTDSSKIAGGTKILTWKVIFAKLYSLTCI